MKRKVYVETSVISYLTARPSKTIIGAAHQLITLAWWELRSDYELFVSQSVWQECAAGDPVAAQKRLAVLEEIPVLAVTQDMIRLAGSLIEQAIIPAKAIEDALHKRLAKSHSIMRAETAQNFVDVSLKPRRVPGFERIPLHTTH